MNPTDSMNVAAPSKGAIGKAAGIALLAALLLLVSVRECALSKKLAEMDSGSMAKKQEAKRSEYWRQMVGEQERSGLPVRTFCEQAGVNEHSFYNWRARLRRQAEPVRFALVEPATHRSTAAGSAVELTLASGEQLRIGAGADAATVRMVLAALRG